MTSSDDPVTPDEHSSETTESLGLTARDRLFLRVLLIIFLTGSSVQWLIIVLTPTIPPELQRGEHFQQFFRVEVNSGSWIDWMQLEGIGPAMAHRIVADRNLHGPFRSIDDLGRVPGIGPVTLDRIRPQLTIRHANPHDGKSDTSRSSPDVQSGAF